MNVKISFGSILFSKLAFAWLSIMLACISCNEKKDIYKILHLGSKLSKKILTESSQIIPYGSGLILVYNFSDDWELVNNHLLFFDNRSKLYGACFLPSNKVDSIWNNVLYCRIDDIKDERKKDYRCDLPKNFQISFNRKVEGWSGRKSDKVVNKLWFSSSAGSEITLDVKKSLDTYQGLKIHDNSYAAYSIRDTIKVNIDELFIEYDLKHITIATLDSKGRPLSDIIVVADSHVLNEFYDAILKRFSFK